MAEESIEAADPLDPNDIEAARRHQQESAAASVNQRQEWLRSRRAAYVRVFAGKSIDGDITIVLNDLKRFCRGAETPWHADPRIHALLTGRFEVYTRISQHLHMSFDELWEVYNKGDMT